MRCWHPRAENVVKEVIDYGPDEIILMPLYTQYSAATSGSSINEWQNICKKNNFEVKTCTLCCYPTDNNFIQAHKDEILKKIKNLDNFKLIFSAHGLPEKNIKKGEELTCDYGFGFDKDYKQFPCKCGAKNCCGYIVRAGSRFRINKKFAISKKKTNKSL